MHRLLAFVSIAALTAAPALAQSTAKKPSAPRKDLVEFGMMTWPEVRDALAAGPSAQDRAGARQHDLGDAG